MSTCFSRLKKFKLELEKMKTRKIGKTLGLKKITIANLSDQEMRMALGGVDACPSTSTIYCSINTNDLNGTLKESPGSCA